MIPKHPNEEIPGDLMDCFRILKGWGGTPLLEEFKKGEPAQYHSGLGKLIRNGWGLWHDPKGEETETEIHKYMVKLGLHHADDMSGLILESFKRHLNGQPLDVDGQVAAYQKYWADKEPEEGE